VTFRWPVTRHALVHPLHPRHIRAEYGVAVGWPWQTWTAPTPWVSIYDTRIGNTPVASLGLTEPCGIWDLLTLLRGHGWLSEKTIGDASNLLCAPGAEHDLDPDDPFGVGDPGLQALVVLRHLAADLAAHSRRRS
jgi:hypothetical protein